MEVQESTENNSPLHPGFYRRNIRRITRKIERLLSLDPRLTLAQSGNFSGIFYPWLEKPIDNVLREYFNIDDLGMITHEEKIDIYVVLAHIMKRSINGLRQFDDKSNASISIDKELSDWKFLWRIGGFLPIHDAFHGVCRYIKDPGNRANDPKRFVPAPFRIKYTGSNDTREIIEEEILATIWLPKQMAQNIAGYTEYVNKLEKMTFWEYCVSTYHSKDLKTKQSIYNTDLLDEIKRNPHPKLVEMFDYIWENRDNPRVLVDLFLKETGPLINKLKKRKVYQKI